MLPLGNRRLTLPLRPAPYRSGASSTRYVSIMSKLGAKPLRWTPAFCSSQMADSWECMVASAKSRLPVVYLLKRLPLLQPLPASTHAHHPPPSPACAAAAPRLLRMRRTGAVLHRDALAGATAAALARFRSRPSEQSQGWVGAASCRSSGSACAAQKRVLLLLLLLLLLPLLLTLLLLPPLLLLGQTATAAQRMARGPACWLARRSGWTAC